MLEKVEGREGKGERKALMCAWERDEAIGLVASGRLPNRGGPLDEADALTTGPHQPGLLF